MLYIKTNLEQPNIMLKSFNIICAVDKHNGIGQSNYTDNYGMRWKIKEDMKQFKKLTSYTENQNKKNMIIMGRKTAELVGFLPDRHNVFISSQGIEMDDFIRCTSVIEALELANKLDDVESIFVIGGGSIYRETINSPLLKYLYVTQINEDYNCDIQFPNIIDNKRFKLRNDYTVVKTVFDHLKNQEVSVKFMKYENMQKGETNYISLLNDVIINGDFRTTRNAKTYSLFGKSLEYDLSYGFPLLTTKEMFMRGIFEELKFFLLGQTNSKILEAKNVNIWKGNTTREFLDRVGLNHYPEGTMGNMYGFQWRFFGADYTNSSADYTGKGVDQLQNIINLLKNDPYSRRIIMTCFDPRTVEQGVLYPCHSIVIQMYVEADDKLSCTMYQRSADTFLGLPFNIASMALFVHIMCELLDNQYSPGRLIIMLGDVHLYEDHIAQAREQIIRHPYDFPQLRFKKHFNKIDDLNDLTWNDIEITDYKYHPKIKANMTA